MHTDEAARRSVAAIGRKICFDQSVAFQHAPKKTLEDGSLQSSKGLTGYELQSLLHFLLQSGFKMILDCR